MSPCPLQRPRRRDRRGMVLLEVMMALTIFALVAFALVKTLDGSFETAEARNQIDIVVRGLDNQLALLHESRLLPGAQDLPDDGSGITYHLEIAQEQMQDQKRQPVPNMYRATITATWTLHGQANERDVSELVYQP